MAILTSIKDKASATSEGLVRLANDTEATTGTATDVAMTPAAVKAQIDALLDGAPAALDTLNELAAAINDDASYFQTIQTLTDDFEDRISDLENGIAVPPGTPSQQELDDTQTGAGLNADGSYTADNTTNYITAATSLKNADFRLDAQIKTNANAIAALGAGNIANLQNEVDAIEASVGIGTDGSYTATSGANYTDSATSVRGEISALDTQIKTNADAISSNDTDIASLQSLADAHESSIGLDADGGYTATSGANYTDGASTVRGEISALDTQVKANADAIASNDTDITDHEGRITTLEGAATNQAEVDAIEASVGINADGSYTATSGANYTDSATSVRGEISALDTQIKSNADDIATNSTAIAGKASSASVTALESLADTHETAVGLNANGTYQTRSGTNYIDSATSIRSEIGLLDAEVATNATDITNLTATVNTLSSAGSANANEITALENEINTTQAGAGLSTTGAYTAPGSSNYLGSATSLKDADNKLDAQIKTNADNISSNDTDIADHETRITTLENASSNQAEVDAIEASVGIGTDGSYTAPSGTNYIDAATSVRNEISLLDTQLKSTQDDLDTAETTLATKASQALVDTHETSIGLNADGTYSAHSGSNYLDSSTSVKDALGDLDTQIKSNYDDIQQEITDRGTAITSVNASISTLQSEVDATQAGAGLSTAGAYVANGSANYISAATSLKDADNKLDAQIKTNADNIASNDTDIATNASDIASLETLADTHETSIGLSAAGAYVSRSGTNYMDAATTVRGENTLLDAQIKTNADNISTNSTAIATKASQALADTHEAAIGLNANGSFVSYSGTNYLDATTTIAGAIETLDTQIKTRQDNIDSEATTRASADTTLQGKIDTVEASVGLAADGSYSAISGANYATSSTSLKAAVTQLDTQLKSTQDDLDSAESIQSSMISSSGFQADGTLSAYSSTNYLTGSLKAALEALDSQVKTNADGISSLGSSNITALQNEIDATQTGAGLGTSGAYTANGSANYIASSTSLKDADDDLDSALKTEADTRSSADTAQVARLVTLEHRCGGIFIDVPASSAVEMDATLSSFRSHTGPWQVDFSAFRTGGEVDIIHYGGQAATNSSQHFIQKNNGDIVFTGNIAAGASILDG